MLSIVNRWHYNTKVTNMGKSVIISIKFMFQVILEICVYSSSNQFVDLSVVRNNTVNYCLCDLTGIETLKYSGTSLKRTLMGQKFSSALERCLPWRGLNWKVSKFKVWLFYNVPTLTRTPVPPYLTMGMWNGEKEVIFLVMYQFILHQRLK